MRLMSVKHERNKIKVFIKFDSTDKNFAPSNLIFNINKLFRNLKNIE